MTPLYFWRRLDGVVSATFDVAEFRKVVPSGDTVTSLCALSLSNNKAGPEKKKVCSSTHCNSDNNKICLCIE